MKYLNPRSRRIRLLQTLILQTILLSLFLSACGTGIVEARYEDYGLPPEDGWQVSTPEEQGLDPDLINRIYKKAARLDTIYSMLVFKNGYLIAEEYFNGSDVNHQTLMASASKSYISTLIGLALEQGCLDSIDQKMLDFFPEYAQQITDPRKSLITIRHMLQMRSGYPWEEINPDLMTAMWAGDNPPMVIHFPLTAPPDTVFQYSNLTSAWLASIVSRSCETNLKDFSEEFLMEPLGVEMGEFWPDMYDDYFPLYHLSARDAAKYGLMYLNEGEFGGEQIIPADWVRDSLQTYSFNVSTSGVQNGKLGRYFREVGYGYQWWSARVGEHQFNYAAGHGGQLIILLHDLDMVIVTKADPFFMQHDGEAWRHEKAIINLVGKFINKLPAD